MMPSPRTNRRRKARARRRLGEPRWRHKAERWAVKRAHVLIPQVLQEMGLLSVTVTHKASPPWGWFTVKVNTDGKGGWDTWDPSASHP